MVKIKILIIGIIVSSLVCSGLTFFGIYFCPKIGFSAIKRESDKIRFTNTELEKTNKQITDELKSANTRIDKLEKSIGESKGILNETNTTINELERINNESRKIIEKYNNGK